MSPATKAPTPPITITNPSVDGATFTGSANGSVSPADSRVSAKFWPGGSGVGAAITGSVTVTGTSWSASFNMTGVAATTTGFLSATNDDVSGAEAHRSNLVYNPTATPGTGGTSTHTASKG